MERLDHFMARSNAAYYASADPFRDFTTAPEITQVFGELLGAWAAIVWQDMDRPTPVRLVEAGPGRGTLMADALRAAAQVAPAFRAAIDLHLIETSPRLRALQAARLQATWHESLDTIPPGPLILLGNEFLDALPIRQWSRREDGWHELYIEDGVLIDRPSTPPGHAAGDLFERSDAAHAFIAAVADRVTQTGGAALFLDYGPAETAQGHTLQAVRNGAPADPLAEPGAADLTAHVDFPALAATARAHGAVVHGPAPQGLFLARLGLFQRTDRLARTQPPARAAALIAAAQRLAEPVNMGRLFKAVAICHPSLTPPGFLE
jgi:SAM-dependent MidA family methyltransferase